MAAKNYPIDDDPNHLAKLAIEQLLNRQEDDNSTSAYDQRAARRLCGRWLLMRRMLRGLSRADVARRIKLDEETLGLIEMGLTDAPLTAADVWLRLALVLEGSANDYDQVGTVIAVTLGQAPVPDADWLARLEAELEPTAAPLAHAVAGDLTQADLPSETVNDADQLIHERITIPTHSMHVLRALRRATGQPLSIPNLKKSILAHEQLQLSVVDLRVLLEHLAKLGFVIYTRGDPSIYRITPVGTQVLFVALRRAEAERRRIEAEQQQVAAERDRAEATSEFELFIANLSKAEGGS